MDRLLVNGRIHTFDALDRTVDALAIRAGRVVAAGASAELKAQATPDTEVIDLGGRTVTPGFIDAHNHFSCTTFEPLWIDCHNPPMCGLQDLLAAFAAKAAEVPAGQWIRGWGYEHRWSPEGRLPTRWELDEACPNNPVVLVHLSCHLIVANSRALALAKIDRDTPDPQGGTIVRADSGEPNGALYEAASGLLQNLSVDDVAAANPEQTYDLMAANGRKYLAVGITTLHDALVTPTMARMYRGADAAGKLPLTVHQMFGGDDQFFGVPRAAIEDGIAPDGRDTLRLKGQTLKLFTDGMFPTMAMAFPLPGGGCKYVGCRFHDPEQLNEMVLRGHRHGWQMAVHALGNHAIALALDAIAAAQQAHPRSDARFRIEHFDICTDALIQRARDLGVIVVIQPVFAWQFGDLYLSKPVPDGMYAESWRRVKDGGVTMAGSSDYPCARLAPFETIAAAVNRETFTGQRFLPEQGLTVREALRLYTTDAAQAGFSESEEGSLEVGKRANLLVLDADPLSVPSEQLSRIQVEQTWVDGELAYEAETAPVRER